MPLRRFGRPGLLGTVARTAVVAGTATMTVNAIARRSAARANQAQEAQAYEEQQAAADQATRPRYGGVPNTPVSAGTTTSDDMIDQLEKLGKLRDSGVLSTDEFEAAKARILN